MTELTWESLRTRKGRVPTDVVHRALAHETVLLNITTSTYHAIDAVGARFFEVILASPNMQAASETLASEYEQPVDRIAEDMVTFCNDLLERDLLALDEGR